MDGKKYNIIYADPPWQYRTSGSSNYRSPERYYVTQPLQVLKAFDVKGISAKDCVLMMWATGPHLNAALELGDAWGFEYKTIAFVWIKLNLKDLQFFVGLGQYTRANAEPVLLFTKGKPLHRVRKDVGQIVIARVGPHSQKPPEVRERIVQLFGDVPRVELFARSRKGFFPDVEYAGWDVFGNEVNGSIELGNGEV